MFRNTLLNNLLRNARAQKQNLSVREMQDRSKAGWSRKQKMLAYVCFTGIGIKVFTHYYKTDLIYSFVPNQVNLTTIKNCPSLEKVSDYLLDSQLRGNPVPYIPFDRQQLIVDDKGGSINLDFVPVHYKYLDQTGQGKETMRILIILHGLTGASESNYIRQTALFASRKGFRTICLNLRGYANSKLTSPEFTNFAHTKDVDFGIRQIRDMYPNARMYALGYSMGANQMMRFLAKDNEQIVSAAVAISVPWNVYDLSQSISSFRRIIYDYAITKNFKRNLKWNLDILQQHEKTLNFDLDAALKARRTRKFDEYITRRMFGYPDVDELYKVVECQSSLKQIQRPVLILSSQDDPVIIDKMIPKDLIVQNPNLILVQTQKGSHIEFFTGAYKPQRWIYKPALEYLDYQDKLNNL